MVTSMLQYGIGRLGGNGKYKAGLVETHAQFGMGKMNVPLVRLPNDFWIIKNLP